jgi:1-acyl-sn-glycerol-3-phosphate acyltransferase
MDDGSLSRSLLVVAETLRVCAPTVLEANLGTLTRAKCDERLEHWSDRLVRRAGIQLDVRGAEHARAGDETFVVMSNHQSHFDIPVIFRAFPGRLRMVAKTELYRIPIFGGAVRAAEFIEIDRFDRARSHASIELAKERLRSGIHVWIAPEGTRSETGRLGHFKKGGFILALETGTRILPVTVEGTRHVLRPHTTRIRPDRPVEVTFHPPVDPKPFGLERRDELVALVKSTIASALPQELQS